MSDSKYHLMAIAKLKKINDELKEINRLQEEKIAIYEKALKDLGESVSKQK